MDYTGYPGNKNNSEGKATVLAIIFTVICFMPLIFAIGDNLTR